MVSPPYYAARAREDARSRKLCGRPMRLAGLERVGRVLDPDLAQQPHQLRPALAG